MAGPYRDTVAAERIEAITRDGQAVLELAPQHLRLSVGGLLEVSIAGRRMTLTRTGKRRVKTQRLELGRLVVARAWPTGDVALWRDLRPGVVERVLGLPPLGLLHGRGLAALRGLDRLGRRLEEALRDRAEGARSATEYGHGQHRVLEIDGGDRIVLHARPVFRERPRRVAEVCADGSLAVPGRKRAHRARVRDRYGVIVSGDRVRFCDPEGRDLASVFLPWIAPEDRAEIARRLQRLVGGSARLVEPAQPPAFRWLGLSEA